MEETVQEVDLPASAQPSSTVVPQEEHPQHECVLDEKMQLELLKCAARADTPPLSKDDLKEFRSDVVNIVAQGWHQVDLRVQEDQQLSRISFGLSLFVGFLLIVSWIARVLSR